MKPIPPILLFASMLLFSCNQGGRPVEENPLEGLWKLVIMEEKDSVSGEWREWRQGMQGYLLYAPEGHMSMHLTTKGYQNTPLRFPNFTDTIPQEALKYLTNSYVYFANYDLDLQHGIVTHKRISHSNPGEWGLVVQRKFSFLGDTLILQPVEERNARLRLKWLKQAAGS